MNNTDVITTDNLNDSIELLSKNLYLESPDLWIDFSDKMNDNNFDEMVLFFAIKYNYPVIVRYAIENKLINLDLPSKNKSFKSIKDHLLSIANKNNNLSVSNYLLGITTNIASNLNLNSTSVHIESESKVKQDNYIPTYICPNCNSNVFLSGFVTTDKITHVYSDMLNKVVPTETQILDLVICNNCNSTLNNITPEKLDNLSTAQNCTSCGLNLTTVGITDKNMLTFDNVENKFISSNTSYHCSNCDNKLNKYQLKHFNL